MSVIIRKSNVERPVFVGDSAPDISSISVVGGSVQELSLKTYRLSKNYVLVLFLPVKGPTAKLAPSRAALFDEFASMPRQMVQQLHDDHKTYVIGVVDAPVNEVLTWLDTPMSQGGLKDVPFPVACDPSGKFSCNFRGVWNSKTYQMNRSHVIIDDKGVVRQITVNDPMVSRNVEEVLRQVTAFKYTDEHGEVCPADWNSGDTGIVPDPQGSKVHFEKKYSG